MEKTEPSIVVIYHANCMDGIAAAWCAWRFFGEHAIYHPGVYGQPMPDVYKKKVYFLDFSVKRDVMQIMNQYAEDIVVLDHHASAIDDLWDLCKEIDMTHCTSDKSGAMIAWDYFKGLPKEGTKFPLKMPRVFPHIQDRDLWRFELEGTREIHQALQHRPKTFEEFDKIFSLTPREYKKLIKEG